MQLMLNNLWKINSHFKAFIARFLSDVNYRVLWLEQLLFSVIIGASFHSVPVFCLMVVGLSWILGRPKGPLYMIYVLSLICGFVAMFVAYCLSGWGWPMTAWGVVVLVCGIGIHFRDLKKPMSHTQDNDDALESNLLWNYRNLN